MTACTVRACALLFNLSLESIFPVRQRGDTLFHVLQITEMEEWIPLDFSLSSSLSSCLHPSVAWLGSPRVTMATRTGAAQWGLQKEKGEEERGGTVHLQKPLGNVDKGKRVHSQLPVSRIRPSAAAATCPPVPSSLISTLCSFILPSSSCFNICSSASLFFPVFFIFLPLFLPPLLLHPWLWISNDSCLVHSGEGEL